MTVPLRWLLRPGSIVSALAIACLSGGCSSDEPGHRAGGATHRQSHLPPLAGQAVFFNGQITAELNVGNGPGFDGNPAKDDETPGTEHKPHGSGGGGMHMGGGGGGGGRHHGGDSDSGGPEGDPSAQVEREHLQAMRHSAASTNPPVMIHLRFTNNGTTHADLLIADFLSPLGNFVVQPEKLALEPGQTVEVEPMTSRLADEISATTVTLALRLAGQGEKQSIPLSIVSGAALGPPPAEAPAEGK
jgi:hypothetical protein